MKLLLLKTKLYENTTKFNADTNSKTPWNFYDDFPAKKQGEKFQTTLGTPRTKSRAEY